MADTIADITITDTAWTDIYAATGFSVGAGIIIQNKSSDFLVIQIKATQPSISDTSGQVLPSFLTAYIDAGESGIWVRPTRASTLKLNVQLQ